MSVLNGSTVAPSVIEEDTSQYMLDGRLKNCIYSIFSNLKKMNFSVNYGFMLIKNKYIFTKSNNKS